MSELGRRDFLKRAGLGASGLVAAMGVSTRRRSALADPISRTGEVVEADRIDRGGPLAIEGGSVIQPRRQVPVLRKTDVLVVGAGAAGVVAAISAARAGSNVTLVERYGYCGGLWTGGLVLIVLATHVKTQDGMTKCVRGIGDELLERLLKHRNGIINQKPGRRNPTSDPEATKYVMDRMLSEAGVDLLLHSWAANVVMDGNAVKGVTFESKSGCYSVLADVVVDATGDGDVFGAAGAEYTRHRHKVGLVHRLGNVDRVRRGKAKDAGRRTPKLGSRTPLPSVNWVNMQGPMADGLNVEELSRLETDGRRAIWKRVDTIRNTPGCEDVFLLETAAQLGVRITRTLGGVHEVSYDEAKAEKTFPDVVAVGGGYPLTGERPVRIPYGALLPGKVDNLLAAGRCVAADNKMMNYTRLIAPCFVTGHAAGAAAALAVKTRRRPRDVNVSKLQQLLKQQDAYII